MVRLGGGFHAAFFSLPGCAPVYLRLAVFESDLVHSLRYKNNGAPKGPGAELGGGQPARMQARRTPRSTRGARTRALARGAASSDSRRSPVYSA